jgi:outer membrane protein assembly factor BamB
MKRYQLQYKKIAITFVLLFFIQYSHAQWPHWRGLERNGISTENNLLKEWPPYGPKLAWSSDTAGAGFSSAAIQDNIIYTTGKRDSVEVLTAFDFSGKILWQTVFGRASNQEWPESRSTPTVYKGKVYAMSVKGDVACIDIKTGKIDWKINAYEKYQGVSSYNEFGESLLVEEDKLIITPAGKTTTMVALNRLTGQAIWETESIQDTSYFTSPLLYQDNEKKIIVSSTLNYFIAVDFNTGKILNKQKIQIGIIPIIDQKQVYFTNFQSSMKLDLSNYSKLWSDTMLYNYSKGSVKVGNKILGTNQNNNAGLICLDWETGKVLSANKEINPASIISANGMIYCYEERNGRVDLIKINEDNTTELISSFRVKLGQGPSIAHLSIANGFLFIRHGKFLVVYDIKQSI